MTCNPLARAWQDLVDTLREGENLAELPTALRALNQELGGRSAAEDLSDEEVARAVERLPPAWPPEPPIRGANPP